MKDKDRNPEQAQLAGVPAQPVDLLLHCITDKDERIDFAPSGLGDGVEQHPLDLSLAADTEDRAHNAVQVGGGGHPAARLALRKAAVIDELDLEPAERRRRLEHLALDPASAIPGRLAAGGGVERKNQPAAPAAGMRHRRLFQLIQKVRDFGRVPLGGKPVLVLAHRVLTPAGARPRYRGRRRRRAADRDRRLSTG